MARQDMIRRVVIALLLSVVSYGGIHASSLIDIITRNGITYYVYPTGAWVEYVSDWEATTIVIEDSITVDSKAYPVVSIMDRAFYGSFVESVKLPVSVKHIGVEAFCGCRNLKSIDLPDSLQSIYIGAFSECNSIESLDIPEKVNFIGSNLVSGCTSLKYINIHSKVEIEFYASAFRISMSYSETFGPQLEAINVDPDNPSLCSIDGVLYTKDLKTLIRCPDKKQGVLKVPEGVERLEKFSLQNCAGLTSVDLPGTLREMGDRPQIPSYTSANTNGVMRNCKSLTEITIPEGVTWIGNHDFAGCANLRRVILPQSLSVIGRNAFINDEKLEEMILPESLDSLDEAFERCYSYQPNLPKNLSYIGSAVFAYSAAPDSLIIGERLRDIGYRAFSFLSDTAPNLKKIYVCQKEPLELGGDYFVYKIFGAESVHEGRKTVEQFPSYLADGCTLYVPTGCKEAYQESPVWGYFNLIEEFDYTPTWEPEEKPDNPPIEEGFSIKTQEDVELKFTITSEDEKTCQVKRVVMQEAGPVTIPSEANGYTVTSIGDMAFSGWPISDVSIPETVTAIGMSAFSSCGYLTALTIPNSVTDISPLAFANCEALTEVVLPEGLTKLADHLFYYSGALSTVNIPKGITSIGVQTFFNCKNLLSVELPETLTEIGDNAFGNCSKLTSIHIPKDVVSIGTEAFLGCYGLNSISVADENPVYDSRQQSSALIETATGMLLKGSQQTVIPDDITGIANEALAYCQGITSALLPESVTSIGRAAFRGCTSLASVHLPEGIESIKATTFSGCTALDSIEIPKGVASIGDDAFFGCEELLVVKSFIEEPFPVSNYTFGLWDDSYQLLPSNATLYVPQGCKEKYENTTGWNHFVDIIEMGASDIQPTIVPSNTDSSPWYTLSGHKVVSPKRGIYIHQGKKVLREFSR